jgi:hypothetical protein
MTERQKDSSVLNVSFMGVCVCSTIAGTVVTCFVTDVHKEELHLLLSQMLKWCVYVITAW